MKKRKKTFKVTHSSGLWCMFKAKDENDLEMKLASGLYSILPIRGRVPVRLTPKNVIKIERIGDPET